MALAPLDINAWKEAVLRRLANGDLSKFGGFDTVPYEQQALTGWQGASNNLAQLDQEENLTKNQAAQNKANRQTARQRALQALQEDMAGRGLLSSSIAVDEQAKANSKFDADDLEADSNLNSLLSQIAGRRLGIESGWNTDFANLGMNLSQTGSEFLSKQAEAAAQQQAAMMAAQAPTQTVSAPVVAPPPPAPSMPAQVSAPPARPAAPKPPARSTAKPPARPPVPAVKPPVQNVSTRYGTGTRTAGGRVAL